jgi:ABC-type dipeptide/oligopeptide/nickel transport system permease subunit
VPPRKQTGRDLFAIVAYGARVSLLVGVGATLLATLFGTASSAGRRWPASCAVRR